MKCLFLILLTLISCTKQDKPYFHSTSFDDGQWYMDAPYDYVTYKTMPVYGEFNFNVSFNGNSDSLAWPAVWMILPKALHDTTSTYSEIDVEVRDGKVTFTVWSTLEGYETKTPEYRKTIKDPFLVDALQTGFHEMRILWTKDTVRFYIDGLFYGYSDKPPSGEMVLIVTQATIKEITVYK